MSIFGSIRPQTRSGWARTGSASLSVYFDPQGIFTLAKDDSLGGITAADSSAYMVDVNGSSDYNSLTAAMASSILGPTGDSTRYPMIGICAYDATEDNYVFFGHTYVNGSFPQQVGLARTAISAGVAQSNNQYFNPSTPVVWYRLGWERVDPTTFTVTAWLSIDNVSWIQISSLNVHAGFKSVDKVGFFARTSNLVSHCSVTANAYHFAETGPQ